ncbi:Hsp33 family molecular chaperone HslO [Altererythrobacter litoralis]|uniref:Hsp33 family molecular chaperone HslO n=1 Tax=Altererythrobacter litoralis TaxID=3113904 RepID=A0ABU7GCR1_9SPHN|nr:Hsp33 family molecular chaperone HslO [Erythrobacteraceae bacterium 1XM1-14]
MTDTPEIFADRLLGFSLPCRDARGRAVRLDAVLDEILGAHDYPAPVTHLLAEALVLAALMGALLKEEGAQLTMQAQTQDGPVRLLVCDYRGGEMRGYADFDRDRLAQLGANPSLPSLFGQGFLAITFETGNRQRYQGIVPLEGHSLAAACETYFFQSEQIPTLLKVGIRAQGQSCVAGGVLLQHLPQGEVGRERLHARFDHPDWEHVAVLAGSLSHDELVDGGLSMEALVWRLFHEESEIRVDPGAALTKGCRCTVAHYKDVLARFPEDERDAMRNNAGDIVVDCAFCSREFIVDI